MILVKSVIVFVIDNYQILTTLEGETRKREKLCLFRSNLVFRIRLVLKLVVKKLVVRK